MDEKLHKIQNNSTINAATFLFAGDYHTYGPFDDFIKKKSDSEIFSDGIQEIVSESDLSVFNLEDPLTDNRKGILKHGPHGVGSEESLKPIKKAGFQLATFATNHTYDMGDEGIKDTFRACRKFGIDVSGAGLSKKEATEIYYKNVSGHNIAILNFSRIEFNSYTSRHGGANPLDVIDNSRAIMTAKSNADFVFVVVHEGVDVFHLPYPRLVKQMRFYADMGANAIILHHSRIINGFEVYNGVPIFYGLGNLLHWSKNPEEHKGLIVRFLIDQTDSKLDFDIIPIELNPQKIIVSVCEEDKKKEILQEIERLSAIIQDARKLEAEWQAFVAFKKTEYLSILAGHPRIFYRLAKKLGLQSLYEKILLINKNKYLSKWNIMKCQAHYEAVNFILDDIFKE